MTDTRLLRILRLLYHQGEADIDRLTTDLIDARKRAWMTAMQAEARRYGYTGPVNPPRLSDLDWIRRESRQDAESIVRTWNRDVDRALDRLYAANYRGNRYYYAKHMEQWAAERAVWKNRQIAQQTEMSTVGYVKERFDQMNGLRGGLSIFDGPPPVCGDCIQLYGMGPVTQAVRDRNPTPRHIGCTHWWTRLKDGKAPAPGELWVG